MGNKTLMVMLYEFPEKQWPSPNFATIVPIELDQLPLAAKTTVHNVYQQIRRLSSSLLTIRQSPHLFISSPVMATPYKGHFEPSEKWVWVSYRHKKDDTGLNAFGLMLSEEKI